MMIGILEKISMVQLKEKRMISIDKLEEKFTELEEIKEVIHNLNCDKERLNENPRIKEVVCCNPTLHFYNVVFSDEDEKKYSDEIIRLTNDYLNKTIYDKKEEYMKKYAELENICNNIQGLDFTDKLKQYKL